MSERLRVWFPKLLHRYQRHLAWCKVLRKNAHGFKNHNFVSVALYSVFGGETRRKGTTWKMHAWVGIVKKEDGILWSGFIWLTIGTSGELF
jgi:hypothetical protein